MAKGDIDFQAVSGKNVVSTKTYQTETGATAILTGEPVKLKSAGSPFVIPLADNEPVIGTTTQMIGIAASDSTETASADGVVDVYVPDSAIVWRAKATTQSNIDTKAKLDALANDRVLFDFISSTYTVDENGTDVATSGVQIVGGDPDTGDIFFTIRPAALEGPIA